MDEAGKDREEARARENPWRVTSTNVKKSQSDTPNAKDSHINVLIAVAGIVLVVGAGLYGFAIRANINQPAAELEARAKTTIVADLRDPSSAEFSDIQVGKHCVTGRINAKNSFGGYVGYRNFYYDDSRNVGQIEPEEELVLTKLDRLKGVVAGADFNGAMSDCRAKDINID